MLTSVPFLLNVTVIHQSELNLKAKLFKEQGLKYMANNLFLFPIEGHYWSE